MSPRAGLTADEALVRPRAGNRRFVSGAGGRDLHWEHARRLALQRDQELIAVVPGCSDSRLPLEMIFDQGLGDLFVVRVAGNVAAPTQIGSIGFAEYAPDSGEVEFLDDDARML
jgi:carbonic anhydrase